MLAGTVTDEHGMCAGRHLSADLGQVLGYRLAADAGHDDGGADRTFGADRAEQVGGVVTVVANCRRAGTSRRPDVGDATLLTDPGFVLEPDFDRLLDRLCRNDLGYPSGEVS
jgi:hypothetical protein